jgi:hypothetical protein
MINKLLPFVAASLLLACSGSKDVATLDTETPSPDGDADTDADTDTDESGHSGPHGSGG